MFVTVDGLAEEGDLDASFGYQPFDFGDHAGGLSPLFRAAHGWHDAVSTELVATHLQADESLEGRRPHRGIAKRVVTLEGLEDGFLRALIAVEAEGADAFALGAGLADEFGNPRQLSGTANEIDVGRPLEDEVFVFLGHAADDADHEPGAVFFRVFEPPESGVDLFLGVGPDAAGVEKDRVGVVPIRRKFITVLAQPPHDELGVEHVHLAADGFDEELLLFHNSRPVKRNEERSLSILSVRRDTSSVFSRDPEGSAREYVPCGSRLNAA